MLHTEDASGAGGMFSSIVVLLRRSSEEVSARFQKVQSVQNIVSIGMYVLTDQVRYCPYNNAHITLH